MLVIIAYDVNTETKEGRKRLRRVAKECQDYGLRVQNSVFECLVDQARYKLLQAALEKLIDPQKDSLRFYLLGDEYRARVVHIGTKPGINLEKPLIV